MARSALTSNQITALFAIVESGRMPGYHHARTLQSLISRGLVIMEEVEVPHTMATGGVVFGLSARRHPAFAGRPQPQVKQSRPRLTEAGHDAYVALRVARAQNEANIAEEKLQRDLRMARARTRGSEKPTPA